MRRNKIHMISIEKSALTEFLEVNKPTIGHKSIIMSSALFH